MSSKLATLLTILLLLIIPLSACGPAAQSDPPDSEAATVQDSNSNLASEGAGSETAAEETTASGETAASDEAVASEAIQTIVVGTAAEFKPFEYIDENGNLVGFDIDLMNAMAQAGGFEVAFQNATFDGLLVALANGEYDAAIAAITVTDERRAMVDFTDVYMQPGQGLVSYLDSGQGIAVRTDNTSITGPESLTAGTRVGVQLGTTGDFYVTDNTDVDVQRFPEAPLALQALSNQDVDAVVTDIAVIADFIKANPDLGLRLAGGSFTGEEYAIAVNKERPEVLALLNDALARVKADGTYDQIFNKWFGSP
jgi:polar amino acid transport system substrate-binding protein